MNETTKDYITYAVGIIAIALFAFAVWWVAWRGA